MPFNFTCPHCGVRSAVDDEFAGQTGPCAACGREVTIVASTFRPNSEASGAAIVVILVLCGALVLFMCVGGWLALLGLGI